MAGLRGFTLVELITVMVLVGILAAFAIPRFANVADYEERGFHDELKQALRYAQKTAITTGCTVTFTISGGNTYSANWAAGACPATGGPVAATPLPGFNSEALQGTAPSSVALTNAVITFTPAGMTASQSVIAVGSRTITVHTTGYVEG